MPRSRISPVLRGCIRPILSLCIAHFHTPVSCQVTAGGFVRHIHDYGEACSSVVGCVAVCVVCGDFWGVYGTGAFFPAGISRRCSKSRSCCLTPRWSQRRLPFEFMNGLSYTTIIEFAEPLAGRRGSLAIVRSPSHIYANSPEPRHLERPSRRLDYSSYRRGSRRCSPQHFHQLSSMQIPRCRRPFGPHTA